MLVAHNWHVSFLAQLFHAWTKKDHEKYSDFDTNKYSGDGL